MSSVDFKDDDKAKSLRRPPLTRKLSLRRSVLEYNLCRVQGNQQSIEAEGKQIKNCYSLRSSKDALLPSDIVDPLVSASTSCPPRSTFLKNLFPKWKQSEPHQWVPAKEKNGFQSSEEMKSFSAKISPGSCTLRRVGSFEQLNHLPEPDSHSLSMDSDVPPPASRGFFGLKSSKRAKDSKHAKKFHTFTFPRLLKRKSKTVVGNGGLLFSEAPCTEALIATSYNELENSPPAKKGRLEDFQTAMDMDLDLPPPAPTPRRRSSAVRMSGSDIMCE